MEEKTHILFLHFSYLRQRRQLDKLLSILSKLGLMGLGSDTSKVARLICGGEVINRR